jgi:hypothetical protein
MSKKDNNNKVFLFEQFVKYNKLNEAEGDDLVSDAVGDEDAPNADTQALVEPEVKDKEFLPRLSSVVEKEFFKELKEHIIYWFEFDENFKVFELDSVEEETRAVVAWAFDSVEEGEEPEYAYKIKYAETYTVGKIEKVEELLLIIHIYDYKDSSNLLKQTEMKITLKNVNALFLKKTIDSLKKRILTVPKSKKDVEKFQDREERRLGDNMY